MYQKLDFTYIIYFDLHNDPMVVILLFALFKGEETDVQRGRVTISRVHGYMRQRRNLWLADIYARSTYLLYHTLCRRIYTLSCVRTDIETP